MIIRILDMNTGNTWQPTEKFVGDKLFVPRIGESILDEERIHRKVLDVVYNYEASAILVMIK